MERSGDQTLKECTEDSREVYPNEWLESNMKRKGVDVDTSTTP